MGKDRKPLGTLAVVALAALLLSAVALAVDVDAARGGKGGGKGHNGGGTTYTGTCTVTPNPLTGWEVGRLSGAGFPAYAGFGITIRSESGNVAGMFATADASGNFSRNIQGWPGTNTVDVSGGSVAATCTFQVV